MSLQILAKGTPQYPHARSVDDALVILGVARPEPESIWLCAGCRDYRWLGSEAPARCPRCGHIHFEQREAPGVLG